MAELVDKVAVVTGGGRGIGRAIALGLADEGARIAVLDLDRRLTDEVAAEITDLHGPGSALAIDGDVGDEATVRAATDQVEKTFGRVDCLINNAAWIPPLEAVLDATPESLERVLRTNVIGCFLTTKHLAPVMIRGGGGRIVYMTSAIGVQANPGQSAYGATKAAVNILTNVAHKELAEQGIRTVAVAPGLTDSPGIRQSLGPEYTDGVAARYPGSRLGQPTDVVPLVTFLCSDAAVHLSGTVITVRPPVN
jgi:NAD(P)-dependent dehydrogenase (short-subunit alcohol dehydrogenase family)